MMGSLEDLKDIPRLCENVCTPVEIFTEKLGPNEIIRGWLDDKLEFFCWCASQNMFWESKEYIKQLPV